jgi:hypothetical protein
VTGLLLTIASLALAWRIHRNHRAGAEDPAELKNGDDQFASS